MTKARNTARTTQAIAASSWRGRVADLSGRGAGRAARGRVRAAAPARRACLGRAVAIGRLFNAGARNPRKERGARKEEDADRSDFDDDRHDQRPPPGACEHKLGELLLDVFPDEALPGHVHGAELVHEVVERGRALVEHLLEARVVVQEAARHQFRRRHRVAVLGVDGDHGDEDAVAGQLLAVAKHETIGIAELEAVDEHHARGHLVDDLAVLGIQLEDVAVLEDEDVLLADAGLTGELGVEMLVPVLAVHRHEILRAQQVEHHAQVFLGSVAADVHAAALPVDHGGARLEQTIDRGHDADLVAGDGSRRDDHGVAFVQAHLRMIVERHARERREGFSLTPRREDEDLLGPVVVDLGELDHRTLGDLQISEVAGDVHVLLHRAAGDGALAAVQVGDPDGLLDAVDVRGEARHDHAALGLGEDLVKRLPDDALRSGRPGRLDVRRVAEKDQDALLAELRERVDVRDAAVDRRVVELVVAGQYQGPEFGAEHDRQGIGHAVAHGDERKVERPQAQLRALAHLIEIDHLEQAVLVEFGLDERQREAAAVHRLVELLQHEGQRPLVILVTVRDDERQDVVAAPEQPSDIGDHEVDAEHLVARELDAAVEHDDLAAVLDGGHVLADLAEAAERDDPEGIVHVETILLARDAEGRTGAPAPLPRTAVRTPSLPALLTSYIRASACRSRPSTSASPPKYVTTPMLSEAGQPPSPMAARAAPRPFISATSAASDEVSGRSTANSSPPSRAMRSVLRSACVQALTLSLIHISEP